MSKNKHSIQAINKAKKEARQMRAHRKPTVESMPEALSPGPNAGDVVLVCVHRPSIYDAHYFCTPPGISITFARPDGSIGGPSTRMMMCTRCCKAQLAGSACQFNADIIWPEDADVVIRPDPQFSN